MREIKFRAWLKKSKEMRNTDFMIFRDGDPVDIYEPIVLMQYTGLKDKNGKEIYEGDLIRYITNQVYPITIDTFHGIRAKIGEESMNKGMEDECEIIGNIYENKDLLTKK